MAIEPDSSNVTHLRQHIALNDLGNVKILQAVVSSRQALLGFATGHSPEVGHIDHSANYLVPALTMDQLVSDGMLPLPDLIKMDVEGAEGDVLIGAKNILAENKTTWFVALHGDDARNGCMRHFAQQGYKLEDISGNSINVTSFTGDEIVAIPNGTKKRKKD